MFAVTKLKLKLFHPCVTETKLQLKPHSHLTYIPVSIMDMLYNSHGLP